MKGEAEAREVVKRMVSCVGWPVVTGQGIVLQRASRGSAKLASSQIRSRATAAGRDFLSLLFCLFSSTEGGERVAREGCRPHLEQTPPDSRDAAAMAL